MARTQQKSAMPASASFTPSLPRRRRWPSPRGAKSTDRQPLSDSAAPIVWRSRRLTTIEENDKRNFFGPTVAFRRAVCRLAAGASRPEAPVHGALRLLSSSWAARRARTRRQPTRRLSRLFDLDTDDNRAIRSNSGDDLSIVTWCRVWTHPIDAGHSPGRPSSGTAHPRASPVGCRTEEG